MLSEFPGTRSGICFLLCRSELPVFTAFDDDDDDVCLCVCMYLVIYNLYMVTFLSSQNMPFER